PLPFKLPAAPRIGCQSPEGSGCPSGALGAGAFRSSSPFAVLGPSVGCFGHCARSMAAPATSVAKAARIIGVLLLDFMRPSGVLQHDTTVGGEPARVGMNGDQVIASGAAWS